MIAPAWAALPPPVGLAADARPDVPAPWLAYARALGERLRARLSDANDPVATRLHAVLDARAAPVEVRLWVAPDATIRDARFASLGDPSADADLRALLLGTPAPPSPPADMRQPIALRLSLTPPPEPAPT